MRKGMSRIFLVTFLLFFGLSLFATDVSAAVGDVEGETIYEMITGMNLGLPFLGEDYSSLRLTIAGFLIAFIYFLIVFDIVSFIPFFTGEGEKANWRTWAVSIAVAVLGFIFIDPAFIYAMVAQYEALAIAISSLIPLMLLFVFVYKIETNALDGKMNAHTAGMMSNAALIIFLGYLIYKTAQVPFNQIIWYLITLAVTIILILFRYRLIRWMWGSTKRRARAFFRERRREGAADTEAVHAVAGEEVEHIDPSDR